jgi:hypothetical protein
MSQWVPAAAGALVIIMFDLILDILWTIIDAAYLPHKHCLT